MSKEGESYLDQLLNTVAPDWEDTSKPPEKDDEEGKDRMNENTPVEGKENEIDGISMEDAIAMLNDLPDTDGIGASENPEEDMEELFGLLSELSGDVDDVPESVEPETFVPNFVEPEEVAEPEPFEPDEPDEPVTTEMSELPDMLENVTDEEAVSVTEEPMAMDDIFQDALSAVGYHENEEQEEMSEQAAEDDIFSLDEVAGFMDEQGEGVSAVPAANPVSDAEAKAQKESKGPGFLKRIFGNVITDTTADEEEKARQDEEELKAKKAAEKEEKKKQTEASKEEKAQQAQEEKERKNQLKAQLAAKKAEKKEEKKRLKAERAAEAAKEVVGKINPVGAAIVVIFFATIGIVTIFGSQLLGRRSSLSDAENYFANEDYMSAYDSISRVSLKEDDEALYRRIRICSQLQKELNSSTNYHSMGMRTEALDSLIKGVGFYDKNYSEAQSLGIQPAYDKLGGQILSGLSENFGVSEEDARNLLTIEDRGEYTLKIQQIAG